MCSSDLLRWLIRSAVSHPHLDACSDHRSDLRSHSVRADPILVLRCGMGAGRWAAALCGPAARQPCQHNLQFRFLCVWIGQQPATQFIGRNSFGGNNFSYQYNTEFGRASEYIFSSRQIRCEGPRAFLGVWADPQPDYWYSGSLYGTNAWDMRAGAGLSVPIGSLNETCKAMSLRLEQQLRFDTSIGIVNACAGMLRRGVAFDARLLAVFPELRPCGSLSLLGEIGRAHV